MDFDEFAARQELAGSIQGLPEEFAESVTFRKFMNDLLMAHERRLDRLLHDRLRPLQETANEMNATLKELRDLGPI